MCTGDDCFDHAIDVFTYIAVPKPYDSKARAVKRLIAQLVPLQMCRIAVLRPIEFDNQFAFQTSEIDDKVGNRHLPAKMQTLCPQKL